MLRRLMDARTLPRTSNRTVAIKFTLSPFNVDPHRGLTHVRARYLARSAYASHRRAAISERAS